MAFGFPTFRQPPLVTYGTGSLKSLGASEGWANTVLCTSAAPAVEAYLRQAWSKSGPDVSTLRRLVKPVGEPTHEMVVAAAAELRTAAPTRLVAIGGGAVLDWARLAWLTSVGALDDEGRVHDRWQAQRRALDLVLVPTTCGSGAEAAAVAVLSIDGRKVPVVSPALLADQVILDSRFLSSVSDSTMASSVADALSHAIEAWMSIVPGRLPRESAVSSLRLLLGDGPAYDRAARLMDAGFLGGVAAAHCSVGVVHAYAHSMARFGLGHGHGNALALQPGLRRLLALPAAAGLLDQLGLSATGLIERVEAMTAAAQAHPDSAIALAVLDAPEDRSALLEAMAAEPCLRTCPLPAATLDLDAFLDDVRDGVAQRC